MANRVGQNLGNYRLTGLLGQGGFAEVYLGEHIYLKTQAAIKVLQARLSNTADMEGFVREAQIVARLVHPNIVRILDFGVDQETPFLVMDYASNGTLRQRHRQGEPVPLPTVIEYVKQIAEALEHAHSQKLIHRDIKPENMLVGQRKEILLSDFGIALVAQSSRYQSTQDVVGTAAYMSPEQIQGKPRPASDQYSLAIVVYEWLSGTRPFSGSFTELCTQHMFAPVPPLRARTPALPLEVEQVIQTALAKDPKARFGSVRAFATALAQAGESNAPQKSIVTSNIPATIPARPDSAMPLAPQAAQPDTTPPQARPPERHLPAWLRAEIKGPLPPEPAPLPSLSPPVKPEPVSEVAQLRNELARYRREMARYRQQVVEVKGNKTRPEGRGGCLTAWLIFQMIGLAVSVISSCVLFSQSQTPGVLALLIVGVILGGISISGLWNLRRWGYYMQMTMASIALSSALLAACIASASADHTILYASVGEAVGAGLAIGLLYWMVHERWEVFE